MRKHRHNTDFHWHQPDGPYQLVDHEQARLYREQGGFVLPGVFTPAEITALVAVLDEMEAEANASLHAAASDRPSISRPDEIVFSAHLVARSEAARAFSMHPKLVALCRDLIGPKVRLYWDQLVYKRPHTRDEFPWHQDNGYTFVRPQQYLTCWIALTDATVDNGCPWIAPGMHRHGTLHHAWTELGFQCFTDYEGALALPLEAGSIAVFSSLTPHRTGPNLTDGVRKAYILQYAADGAQVLPRGGGAPVAANAPDRQYLITGEA